MRTTAFLAAQLFVFYSWISEKGVSQILKGGKRVNVMPCTGVTSALVFYAVLLPCLVAF